MALEPERDQAGLNLNARPASVDFIAQQRTIFPMEGWDFDDANRVDNPVLRMKAPWTLVSDGFVVYEDGVDQENLQVGDRRALNEGEIFTLQHWDGSDWISDISLGGYDVSGNFLNFVLAKGLAHPTNEADGLADGFPIEPITYFWKNVFTDQKWTFDNMNGQPRKLGEFVTPGVEESATRTFAGNPMFIDDGTGLSYMRAETNIDRAFPATLMITGDIPGVGHFSGRFISDNGSTTPDDEIARVYFLTRQTMSPNVSPFYLQVEQTCTLEVVSNQLVIKTRGVVKTGTTTLDDTTATEVLVASMDANTVYSYTIFCSDMTDISTTGTPIFLQCGAIYRGSINAIDVDFDHQVAFSAINTGLNITTQKFSSYTKDVTTTSQVQRETKYACTDLLAKVWMKDPNDFNGNWNNIDDIADATAPWAIGTDYWSLFDSTKDVVIAPSPLNGKTVIIGSNILDGDNQLILTGPTGLQGETGETGATGPTGPDGASFFDGGTWDTVYVADQYIDGGSL